MLGELGEKNYNVFRQV